MGLSTSRSGRRSAREARMPHDCHVAPQPLARPLGPAYKHHARHAQRHRTRSRSHSPSTHAGAGGWVIKTERASHDARSERDVVCDCWTDCDFVNTCAGFMLLPFHAVVVCSICGRACWIHAWVVAPAWHIQRIPRYPFVRAFCRPPGAWHADGMVWA